MTRAALAVLAAATTGCISPDLPPTTREQNAVERGTAAETMAAWQRAGRPLPVDCVERVWGAVVAPLPPDALRDECRSDFAVNGCLRPERDGDVFGVDIVWLVLYSEDLPFDAQQRVFAHELLHLLAYCGGSGYDGLHLDEQLWKPEGLEADIRFRL